MKTFFFATVMMSSVTFASGYKISCTSGNQIALNGFLDVSLNSYQYEDYGLTLKSSRLSDASSNIDSRCGDLTAVSSDDANFDITSRQTWGQDILQIPTSFFKAGAAASFKARLHSCWYDGDESGAQDIELSCTVTPTPKI